MSKQTRFVRYLPWIGLVVTVALGFGWVAFENYGPPPALRVPIQEPPQVGLQALIEEAIGTQSVDCGQYFIRKGGRPAASASELRGAITCVTQHAAKRVPARMIAELASIDSWVAQGLLAHRDGTVQYFIYDYLWGGGSPRARALDPLPCALPTVVDSGRLGPSVFTSHLHENEVLIICTETHHPGDAKSARRALRR